MYVETAQFFNSLYNSGLMATEEVDAFRDSLPHGEGFTLDVREIARELVRCEKLTRYQAEMLLQGRAKGFVLGDYVIVDKLGAGGMGVVFKARHRRMKRIVALKILPPGGSRTREAVVRFEREVEAAAKLSHPNIVTAFDAGQQGKVLYLVMEYVDGPSLANLVRQKGPLPVGLAVDYIIQTARGLVHAHSQGIIHRDIKPNNLLVDSKGVVKILDMGLARMDNEGFETAASDGLEALATNVTQAGSIVGTVDFMSPEQARNGTAIDHRADIYSLGCTFYYLLTGSSMFGGETVLEKLVAHREDPIPSLLARREEVPVELETVFRRMVAKDLDDRLGSMLEVIQALEKCQQNSSLPWSNAEAMDAAAMEFLATVAVNSTPAHRLDSPSRIEQELFGEMDAVADSKSKRKENTSLSVSDVLSNINHWTWIWSGGVISVLLLLLIVASSLRGRAGQPAAKNDPARSIPSAGSDLQELIQESPAPPPPLEDGPAVDLLELSNPDKHQVSGKWYKNDQGQLVGSGFLGCRLMIPCIPSDEYLLHLTVQLANRAGGGLYLGLVGEGRQFLVVIDQHNLSGVDNLEGEPFSKNETTYKGKVFRRSPVPLEIEVRAGRLLVRTDEKVLVDWAADYHRLELAPLWTVPHPRVLMVGTVMNSIVIHRAVLAPLKGAAEPLAEE